MNWRKIGQICAISYISLYMAAMIMPRKLPYDEFSSDHANFIKRAFHQILYYGGPLEPIANFLVLIPVYVILVRFLRKSKSEIGLGTCIALSVTAEFLQYFIPGRISSVRDFTLNSSGAISAYLIHKFLRARNANL